eukprot:TRINITY_DN8707_c0_g1_i1.p1 TRINITY_DN8707_c0_g1~~TRINITY_DN8707_c0_g1_i1.p1  ORF type:complete len:422 (+),score=99.09 TRINITY_DN8707_c0_g1_i1:1200-2465(+)
MASPVGMLSDQSYTGSRRSMELQKLAAIKNNFNPKTPWVTEGLQALSKGKEFLDEANGRCISEVMWKQWEDMTRVASDQDVRKHWKEKEKGWYSPRGVKLLRCKRQSFTWQALGDAEEEGDWKVSRKRIFSASQLEVLVEKISESKAAFDRRYSNTAVPKQTMHHHMRTFLDKAALANNASTETVMRRTSAAIAEHKKKSNVVAVFDAILKNEIEEEFRMVQAHLKTRIDQMVRQHVADLSTNKLMQEKLLEERFHGYVHQEEWEDIIRALYNQDDALVLIRRCHVKIASYAPARKRVGPISVPNPSAHPALIKYADFVNVCLDFQLESHAAYLKRYVQLFRALDHDDDGLLNERQFVKATQVISPNITLEMSHTLLDMADVGGTGSVTFSDSVNVLHRQLSVWLEAAQHDTSFNKTLNLL